MSATKSKRLNGCTYQNLCFEMSFKNLFWVIFEYKKCKPLKPDLQ